MKYVIIPILLIVSFIFTIHAQTVQISKPDGSVIDTTEINRIVIELMEPAKVTGLCLGIINNNKIAFVNSYGYKNKTKNELNDINTCFSAASFSKSLFAYLVMQLYEKGIIDLDKPLYTYLPKPLPEYEDYKDLAGDERWKLITARNCLDHTTGFPNWRQLNPRNNQKLEIFFRPGERYAYSGEGICLLQFVIETITNRQLEDLSQEYIFKPFGMTRSSFVWKTSFEKDYADGYDMDENILPKNKWPKGNAAGSLETTITDWTRFIEGVMQGKGLSPKLRKAMLSPQIGIYTKRQFPTLNNDTTSEYRNVQLSYGLGWGLFKSPYGWAFFKEGHNDGWEHYCISFPDKKQSFIIMTNSSNGESIFKDLLEKIFSVTIPWKWEGFTPYRASINLTMNTMDKYTGSYSLQIDPKEIGIIKKVNDKLVAKFSDSPELPLTFQSITEFEFKDVPDIKGKFVIENGEVTKMIIDRDGLYEWIKKK